MPHTGLFLLHSVSGDIDASSKRLTHPRTVKALCLSCRYSVDATEPPDLEVIKDGIILYCRNCGTRQAISHERFAEFWDRVRIFREIANE